MSPETDNTKRLTVSINQSNTFNKQFTAVLLRLTVVEILTTDFKLTNNNINNKNFTMNRSVSQQISYLNVTYISSITNLNFNTLNIVKKFRKSNNNI